MHPLPGGASPTSSFRSALSFLAEDATPRTSGAVLAVLPGMSTADPFIAGDGSPPKPGRPTPWVLFRDWLRFVAAFPWRVLVAMARRTWIAGAFVPNGLRSVWSRRSVRLTVAALAGLVVLPASGVVHYVYFDRSRLPDLAPFLRFEPPRIGEVTDARGKVLIELAHEYRRVVSYDEVPLVLRQAVLAAEDKNFFSHSGVDYSALPRVIRTTSVRSLGAWRNGAKLRLLLPQGGSTLTQQLVRAYFLGERTSQQNGGTLFYDGLPQRILAKALGVPATNKLLRKLEEVRLALWLEEEMCRRYGTKEQAKREIFARSASFHYVGNGRYGLAAGSEYYFGKSPRDYAPAPAIRGLCTAATRSWPSWRATDTSPRAWQRPARPSRSV